MRKTLTLFVVLALLAFTACEKEKIESPGNIPGMGYTEGELSVDAFELPEGIELVGTITGLEETTTAAISKDDLSLKSTFANEAVQTNSNYGSGGQFVKLKCQLRNRTNQQRTMFFPKGLVCKVKQEGYQSGILLQWAWVSLKPNEERTFILHLYCINKGKSNSDAQSEFEIHGITNSNTMWKLLNLIGWGKINWEHFNSVSTSTSSLKETSLSYDEIASGLQDAVWALTNGDGLTEDQIEFINAIPQLDETELPSDLLNNTIDPLKYYPEYGE
ncbi:hypothetical protein [Carboxylicivirga caseinilyticus]|uniref:hypothetical protein n=1 Tax=Carboxylicivirga caseinilyticus TaxID=3417572 RepID=UPI003D34CF8E|nr:hypothetical protein [Marinilabiliaceae bacterium A049]